MDPLDIIQGLQSLIFVFWLGDEVKQLYKKSQNFSQAHCVSITLTCIVNYGAFESATGCYNQNHGV